VALVEKIRRYQPRFLGVLGLTAYRTAFQRPKTQIGLQAERFAAAPDFPGTRLWVLPNPSGLNAHYQLEDLARLYRELKDAADSADG
jgi:TDG/mug DNA glycosylase family protein